MQLAIAPQDTVAGDDERHGVGGVGSPDGTGGTRFAQLAGNVAVGAFLAVGDGVDEAQDFCLGRGEDRPIYGEVKGVA